MRLERFIRDIPDFPKKGILFRDITPLLKDPRAFKETVNRLSKFITKKPHYIMSAESRGFIFGASLAHKLGCGFIPVRKKGKLPYKTYRISYTLEYGRETFEVHQDALKKNEKILIVDDLLATGGTAQAIARLAEKMEAKVVGVLFVIELTFLKGRDKLNKYKVHSLIKY